VTAGGLADLKAAVAFEAKSVWRRLYSSAGKGSQQCATGVVHELSSRNGIGRAGKRREQIATSCTKPVVRIGGHWRGSRSAEYGETRRAEREAKSDG